MSAPREIVLVTEDEVSEVAMRRVIADLVPTVAVGERAIRSGGFGNIKRNIARYRNASHVYPHFVLIDLDRHACPVALLQEWNALDLPPGLRLRAAIRSIEAWLMADRDARAGYLDISVKKVPTDPEKLDDAKRTMIELAKLSRSRRLRAEMVPEQGSSARQGPLYNTHLVRFVATAWRPGVAVEVADSLARSCRHLQELGA